MNEETVLEVLEFLRHACPSQKFEEESFSTWARLLQHVPGTMEDVEKAVVAILGRQRRVEPSDLIAELKAIRADRIERAPLVDADMFGPDDKYRPQLVAYLQGIADGGRGLALMAGPVQELPPAESQGPSEASVQARAVAHGGDERFVRERDLSMTIECRSCGMAPGQVCVNLADWRPLVKFPAHLERLIDVGLETRADRPSLEEQKAILLNRSAVGEAQDTSGRP